MAIGRIGVCLICVLGLLGGCRTAYKVHDPQFADITYAAREVAYDPISASSAMPPIVADLEGPQPVERYIAFALRQNPEIQAARKQVEAFAYQVPVAASLQDPMFGVTAFPEQVQTAAGQQELLVTASQKVPWFGKLSRQADVAEAHTNVARARLAAAELATIENVKRPYYELYFVQQAIRVTEEEQKLLMDIREVAETRYSAGQTSQQDVLRADLEVSNVENQLIQLRQQLESAQARLARVLHISPQTRLRAVDRLPMEQLPGNLERLQQQAIAARPELHAQLAALERDQQKVDLARLDYFPDMTIGATWIDVASAGISPVANGRDSFLIGTTVNLPIYRKRLESSVRSAEAQVVASARQYDALRDATLADVMDLFAKVRSQQDLLILFDEDILPRARQTLDVSSRAYNVGEVDFLQLIDNWRQLLRYEVTYFRLEASLRQSLAELERVVGGFAGPAVEPIRTPDSEPEPLPQP